MKQKAFNCQDEKGFTLLELITVMVVAGIVAAIAVPAFEEWVPEYKLRNAANDFYTNLHYARMGAIRSRESWTVNITDTGYTINNGSGTAVKTVDFAEVYGTVGSVNLIKFKDPAGGVAYVTPLTFTSVGICSGTIGYAYLTNYSETKFYRIGPLMSGVAEMALYNGSSWVVK